MGEAGSPASAQAHPDRVRHWETQGSLEEEVHCPCAVCTAEAGRASWWRAQLGKAVRSELQEQSSIELRLRTKVESRAGRREGLET